MRLPGEGEAGVVLPARTHPRRRSVSAQSSRLFATLQIAEGTDARLVADLLGHATVAFTLMVYTHPAPTRR